MVEQACRNSNKPRSTLSSLCSAENRQPPMAKEAKARIRINDLLLKSGWASLTMSRAALISLWKRTSN
jgi:hypothetical protein